MIEGDFPQFYYENFHKYRKLKGFYSQHPFTHLDSTINILLYLLCRTY